MVVVSDDKIINEWMNEWFIQCVECVFKFRFDSSHDGQINMFWNAELLTTVNFCNESSIKYKWIHMFEAR